MSEKQDSHRKESICCELLTRILFTITYNIYFSLMLGTQELTVTDTGNTKIRMCAGTKDFLSEDMIVHKNVLNIFAVSTVFSIMQGFRRN